MRRPDPVRKQAPRYVATSIKIRHAPASPPDAPRTRGSTASQLKRKRPNDSQHKTLKQSIGKAALAYTEKFIGPKETIGNKQGSLGNRIRAVLKMK